MPKIENFSYGGEKLQTHFISSSEVVSGVTCDVYEHPETKEKDLGVITIEPGKKTPLQKLLSGTETIEGYISGAGTLIIIHTDGTKSEFVITENSEGFSYNLQIGEILQWQAADDQQLIVFEICIPPYQDGRFENIQE